MLPYVTGAKEPRVRKRGDDFLERAHGWAVDRKALILLDAVRGLERVAGGKFRPVEPWRLTVRQRPFIGEVKERSGTVPVDANVETGASSQEVASQAWVDVIDVLPAPVRKQIHATVPNPEIDFDILTQGYEKGVPSDHEAGLVRVAAGHMIALTATRRISVSRRMSPGAAEALLAEASWEVTTVTARLGPEQATELSTDRDQPLSVSGPRRGALSADAIDPARRD